MKNVVIIIDLFVILLTLGCTKPKAINENEIYSILNQIIADDSLRFHDLNNSFIDFQLSENCRKEFNDQDLEFMFNLQKEYKGSTIKDKYLKEFWPIDSSFHFIKIDSISNNFISIPLLSKDKQKALIYISTGGGLLSEQSAKFLYSKINGRWIRKKIIDLIVS